MESYQILFSIQSALYFLMILIALVFSIVLLVKKKSPAGILMVAGSFLNLIIGIYRRVQPILFPDGFGGGSSDDYLMRQAYIGIIDVLFYGVFIVGIILLIFEYLKSSKEANAVEGIGGND